MDLGFLWVLSFYWLISRGPCVLGEKGPVDMASLISSIIQHSSPRLRPVRHWDTTLTVQLDLRLYSILDVNEKEEKVSLHVLCTQRWKDEFLSWDPAEFSGLSHFTLPVSSVWTPDIIVREAVSVGRVEADAFVSVNSTGWVQRIEPLLLVLRCDLAMFRFPFDSQRCNLTFGPNLHTVEDVELVPERSAGAVLNASRQSIRHGEWELLSIRTYSFTETQGSHSYSRITFQVEMGRSSLFYVVNLIVPSGFVMLIDLAGFAIPVESAERIPFKVTLLLGYTVFLVLVNDLLPPFRENTPILGVYFVVCLAFLSLSVGESMILLALGKPDILHHVPPLPRLATLFFPDWMKNKKWAETQTPLDSEFRDKSRLIRDLQRAYRLGEGQGQGQGSEARSTLADAMQALEAELWEVSEELRILTHRGSRRRARLQLMETTDWLCFCVYVAMLAAFLLILMVFWMLGH
ncbi:5-hydroxytryptamine receptor 3A-like [Lepisosteus oculatus]|uniref:5-hydroxytryptamine receptor 3A-like n=1 Tax=Lepisosteus oculatus TaxID=7918 RepID=UPI0035F529E9